MRARPVGMRAQTRQAADGRRGARGSRSVRRLMIAALRIEPPIGPLKKSFGIRYLQATSEAVRQTGRHDEALTAGLSRNQPFYRQPLAGGAATFGLTVRRRCGRTVPRLMPVNSRGERNR